MTDNLTFTLNAGPANRRTGRRNNAIILTFNHPLIRKIYAKKVRKTYRHLRKSGLPPILARNCIYDLSPHNAEYIEVTSIDRRYNIWRMD